MRDNIDNKELPQYEEIPRLTFLVKEEELKKQLIIYAEELSESLLVASQKYAKYEYPENRQVLSERAELAELLNYFNNYLNCQRYSQELVKMTKPELHKYISYLCDALEGIGENVRHVIYNSQQPVEYFIKNLDHQQLGEMLLLVYKYTNEYVRRKVVNYLEEKMDIIFDLDAKVATGQTRLHNAWLEHHLNKDLARAEKKSDIIKGALILAHELHHSGDPATVLEEEVMASLATMKMLERIIADLKYEPDDVNIQAQWQSYNLLGEERFVAALEAQVNQGKNFPVLETDQSVLRGYYDQEFKFIQHFLSASDYDSFLLKYITDHPLAYVQYSAGQLLGLVAGTAKGVWNMNAALSEIVGRIVRLLVELMKSTGKSIPKMPETVWDMFKFIWLAIELLGAGIKQQLTGFDKTVEKDLLLLQDIAALGSAFVDFIKVAPGAVCELFTALKEFCYQEISNVVKNWAKRSPYDEGFQLGEVLGIIVFEIIIAVAGAKGVDKLAMAAKTGSLAALFAKLKLDKVIAAIEKLKAVEQKLIKLLKDKGGSGNTQSLTNTGTSSSSSSSTGTGAAADLESLRKALNNNITGGVGAGCPNKPADVQLIARGLKAKGFDVPAEALENGESPAPFIDSIKKFQKDVMGNSNPDGKIDPNGASIKKLFDKANNSFSSGLPEMYGKSADKLNQSIDNADPLKTWRREETFDSATNKYNYKIKDQNFLDEEPYQKYIDEVAEDKGVTAGSDNAKILEAARKAATNEDYFKELTAKAGYVLSLSNETAGAHKVNSVLKQRLDRFHKFIAASGLFRGDMKGSACRDPAVAHHLAVPHVMCGTVQPEASRTSIRNNLIAVYNGQTVAGGSKDAAGNISDSDGHVWAKAEHFNLDAAGKAISLKDDTWLTHIKSTSGDPNRNWQTLTAEGYDKGDPKRFPLGLNALPGRSKHITGDAIDVNSDGFTNKNDAIIDLIALHFGLIRPVPDEQWHFECTNVKLSGAEKEATSSSGRESTET